MRQPHWLGPLLHVDRREVQPILSLRHGVIVAAALGGGFALDEPRLGFAAAMGALQVGFYDTRAPYRARLETMAAATVALALAATIGAASHGTPAVADLVTVIAAFAGGLLAAVGPNATLAGIHSTVLILVFSSVASGNPVTVGLGIVIGGALQSVVSLGGWARDRYGPEERALTRAWGALADLGVQPDELRDRTALLALADAASTLATSSAKDSDGQRLRGLLDRADWLRLELVALGRRADAGAARLREATSHAIAGVTAALLLDGRARVTAGAAALAGFQRATADPAGMPPVRLTALEREVHDTVALLDPTWTADARTPPLRRRQGPRDLLHTVTAAAHPGSPLLRHAVRLALAVAVAHVVAAAAGLDRGYWVAMTAVIVLRPDYSSTMQRGLGRIAGTVAGVLVAWGTVSLLGPGRFGLVVLVGIFATATYLLMRSNLALGATALTALITCLLEAEGQPVTTTASARLVDTVVGGAIALAVYLLLPTWQSDDLPAVVARSVDASRAWARLVLGGLVDRRTYDAHSAHTLGSTARRARAEAELAVEGAKGEPRRSAERLQTAVAVVAANRRLNRALLSLEVMARTPLRDRPELSPTVQQLDQALDDVAERLRDPAPESMSHEVLLPDAEFSDPVQVEVGRALDAAQALLDLTRTA